MEDIIIFIKDNYWWLIVVISGVVEFILLLLLKKRPVYKFIDEFYQPLVTFIQQAESIYGSGHGKEKKEYVLKMFMAAFPTKNIYTVMDAIEDILETPQKKGV